MDALADHLVGNNLPADNSAEQPFGMAEGDIIRARAEVMANVVPGEMNLWEKLKKKAPKAKASGAFFI